MVELEVCGRKFRIRKLDDLNLKIDEYREVKSTKGDPYWDWKPFSNYFQSVDDALKFIDKRVGFDAVGGDDVVQTYDEFLDKVRY